MKKMAWMVAWGVITGVAVGNDMPLRDEKGGALTAEPMVVTARGYETAAALTPGSMGVVDMDTAALYPAVSASDLLRSVSGVSAVSDGAWGSEVNIRGLSRESVVLLIDGVRVNTATDIGARFGTVDPMAIERIEVLKGPISALYGSGSIGGVVNVVTRQGRFAERPDVRAGFSVRAGDNPAGYDSFLHARIDGPRHHWFASQSWRDRASYTDGTGRKVENSQFQDRESRLRGAWRAGEAWTFDANLQHFEGRDIGVPGSGAAPLPTVSTVTYPRTSRSMVKLGGTLAGDGDLWDEFRVDVYWQRIERRVRIDGLPPASPVERLHPQADHDTIGTLWTGRGGRGAHAVTLGVDAWQRAMTSSRRRVFRSGSVAHEKPLPDVTYLLSGVFAENVWTVSPLATLSMGGRWDRIQVDNDPTPQWERQRREESSWNAHLGGVVNVSERARLRAVAASGYRAASLEERYQFLELGAGRVKLGDPDLNPERSLFFEAGADGLGESVSMGWTVFANRLRDLIGERFVDESTIVNANVDEALIWGAEWDAAWMPVQTWTLSMRAAYAEGRDMDARAPLPGIPPLSGAVALDYAAARRYRGRAEAVFAADQRKTPDGVADADGWATANASVSRRLSPGGANGDVTLTVNNIFDSAYRDYLSTYRGAHYMEPGRSVTVQVRFDL